MDILRLPSALRRSVLQHPHAIRRFLSTTTAATDGVPHAPPPREALPTTPPGTLLKLTPTTLNTYTLATAPSPLHLRQANAFFSRHDPVLLYTTPHFRDLPPSPYPEIAILGRSNVGKSSLLNALFGRPRLALAKVSKKPGKTRTMNGYGVGGDGVRSTHKTKKGQKKSERMEWKSFGRGGIIVVDMPGYGKGSQGDWGPEIMKYLENRKQLRRIYVLVDTGHGLKKTDAALLVHLRKMGLPYQIVLSKVDKVLFPNSKAYGPERLSEKLEKLKGLREGVEGALNEASEEAGVRSDVVEDVLCCSGNPEKPLEGLGRPRMIGVDELRWNMLMACGMEGSGSLELGAKMKAKIQGEEKRQAPKEKLENDDDE